MTAQSLVLAFRTAESVGLNDSDLGEITGSTSRTIKRWRAGDVQPSRQPGQVLLELAYVAKEAARTLHPDDVNWWMFAPDEELDGESPASLIKAGRYREVLDLLDAIADGVVF